MNVNWLGTGGTEERMRCPRGHVWPTRVKVTGPGFREAQVSDCPECGLAAEDLVL